MNLSLPQPTSCAREYYLIHHEYSAKYFINTIFHRAAPICLNMGIEVAGRMAKGLPFSPGQERSFIPKPSAGTQCPVIQCRFIKLPAEIWGSLRIEMPRSGRFRASLQQQRTILFTGSRPNRIKLRYARPDDDILEHGSGAFAEIAENKPFGKAHFLIG